MFSVQKFAYPFEHLIIDDFFPDHLIHKILSLHNNISRVNRITDAEIVDYFETNTGIDFVKKHLTYTKLHKALKTPPYNIPIYKLTPFKLAMKSNPECITECPIESYRAFYQTKQHRFKMAWTKRPKPEWFKYANV